MAALFLLEHERSELHAGLFDLPNKIIRPFPLQLLCLGIPFPKWEYHDQIDSRIFHERNIPVHLPEVLLIGDELLVEDIVDGPDEDCLWKLSPTRCQNQQEHSNE
jgi:hypothetical protein